MADRPRIGNDYRTQGRLRVRSRPIEYQRRYFDVTVRQRPPAVDSQQRNVMPTTKRPIPSRITSKSATQVTAPRQNRSKVLQRQLVRRHTSLKRKKQFFNSQTASYRLMVAMAVVVFLIGILVSISSWRTNKAVIAQVKDVSAQTTDDSGVQVGDVPSEEPIPEQHYRSYSVAPDMPRYIRVPTQQINARVMPLGVKANNELAAPASIFDAGWYKDSARPGEGGTALIDAHVSGPTQKGAFYNLKHLTEGEIVEIERGDGQIIKYKVVKSQWYDYDKVDMAAALTSIIPGKPALNLITCGGKFNAQENRYEQRLIVFTVAL